MNGDSLFRFGEFTLDTAERRLSRGDLVLRLPPKALDLLIALVRDAGRLVTKKQLLARVWADSFVEEGILTVQIAALRKTLGDAGAYIETVPRSGYRFVAPVTTVRSASGAALRAKTRPMEVYELVGRGRAHLLSGSASSLSEAVEAFRAAADIDPEYAAAHAGLALACCTRASVRMAPHPEEYAAAKVAALRALAVDPDSADAHVALGTVLFLSEWAWADAERSLRRALAINPSHTEGLLQYGALMEALGRLDEGLDLKFRALARDSRSTLVLLQIAMSYWHQRNYGETLIWAQRALDVDPRHVFAIDCLAAVYWKLGDIDLLATEIVRHAAAASGPSDEMVLEAKRFGEGLKRAYAAGGFAGVAAMMVQVEEARPPDPRHSAAVQRAVFCGAARRLDEAFEHLDQAIASRDPALVHLAVAPQWDSLRDDPRFKERLRRMALSAVAA